MTITIAIRAAFYAWFEPLNWEWHMVNLALILAAGGVSMAHAPSALPRLRRVLGVATWVALAVSSLAPHAATTLAMRDHRHQRGFEAALRSTGPGTPWLSPDDLRVPFGTPVEMGLSGDRLVERAREWARHGRSSVGVIMDVHLLDGMPASFSYDRWAEPFWAALLRRPDVQQIRSDGKTTAIIVPLGKSGR